MKEKKKNLIVSLFLKLLLLTILYLIICFFYSIYKHEKYYSFKVVNLKTTEAVDKALEFFDIIETDNIKTDKLAYDPQKKCIYLLIYDIKDLHKLYFDNFKEYELTEEEFKSVFDVPFDDFGMIESDFSVQHFQGTKDTLSKNGAKTTVKIYKTDHNLCCELGKEVHDHSIYDYIEEFETKE